MNREWSRRVGGACLVRSKRGIEGEPNGKELKARGLGEGLWEVRGIVFCWRVRPPPLPLLFSRGCFVTWSSE